jgi:hypothetical protein
MNGLINVICRKYRRLARAQANIHPGHSGALKGTHAHDLGLLAGPDFSVVPKKVTPSGVLAGLEIQTNRGAAAIRPDSPAGGIQPQRSVPTVA